MDLAFLSLCMIVKSSGIVIHGVSAVVSIPHVDIFILINVGIEINFN